MRNTKKYLAALAVAGMVAASGSAYTASNTVDPSDAGSGTTAIGGYTTTNIQYKPNSTNPENLDSVTFTLDKEARYVAAKTHAAGMWFRSDDLRLGDSAINSCTSTGGLGLTWTCDVTGATPNETVLAADSLSVVATD